MIVVTNNFIIQQKNVAALISEVVDAERIYGLGCTISQMHTESIFTCESRTYRFVSHCYMLVLVKTGHPADCDTLQDKIENHCRYYTPVTAIVADVEQYNNWLTEGHPFATKVYKIAGCLYGAGNAHITSKALDEQQPVKINDEHYKQGINKTAQFIAHADFYRIREQNKKAAFMLHQAAAHALQTLLRITTGLCIKTHNIDRLIHYCSMISYKPAEVFNRNNGQNERLFQLLQKAYTDNRHKEDYTIGHEDLLTLTERVRILESIVKETYHNLIK